jgi:hypothetical protein
MNEPVILNGQGYWLEEDQPETVDLTWSSSLDGNLGRGAHLTVALSAGLHAITLRAGSGERVSSSTVSVNVSADGNQPPAPAS